MQRTSTVAHQRKGQVFFTSGNRLVSVTTLRVSKVLQGGKQGEGHVGILCTMFATSQDV